MKPLFDEWTKSMETSVLRIVGDRGSGNPEEIARVLGISEKSALTLVCGMVEKGILRVCP